jgi:Domain of Unknown Function (DUF1080)
MNLQWEKLISDCSKLIANFFQSFHQTTKKIMKKAAFLMLIVALASCNNTNTNTSTVENKSAEKAMTAAAANTLSEEETKQGYKLLFDGKSLAGWHNFNKTTIGPDWIVDSAEQALYLDVKKKQDGKWYADGGDIVSADSYENYELQIEWKIDTCGNSGIIYNIIEDPKLEFVWHSGPEMQVLDNKCHPDAKIIKHRAGDLYDLQSSSQETVKPALEWNQAKLVQNKGKVEHWLNGVKVVEYDMNAPAWKEMIKGSKFKDMPKFGSMMKGHIALQDHGNKVWYRNMKVRAL